MTRRAKKGPAGVLMQYDEEPKEAQHNTVSADVCGPAGDNLCIIRARGRMLLITGNLLY